MKTYQFEYEEISFCWNCPLNYDYIYCSLDTDIKTGSLFDEKKPENCPLICVEKKENDA